MGHTSQRQKRCIYGEVNGQMKHWSLGAATDFRSVHALFITRVNNSAWYQCRWSNPSVCDLQRVCCRGKLRQVFPGTAAALKPCTALQRALRLQSPLHQQDKEKPIAYCYAALRKKMWRPFTFFCWKKKSIPWGMRGGGRFVSVLILWLMSRDLAI